MQDQLVSFQVAKLAKEKGFNESCIFHYGDTGELHAFDSGNRHHRVKHGNIIFAPTQSLLQKWLREVHNIVITVSLGLIWGQYYYEVHCNGRFDVGENFNDTYEEALEAGLIEALNLIQV